MSYETNVHSAQMKMLSLLVLSRDVSFAELQKTAGLESDAANFHIKQLAHAGYITKDDDGRYRLTMHGKEYANRMDTEEHVIERQPKLSVALIIENEHGEFLSQQRLKHPYYGFWGRPTGKIRWGETVEEAAARELMEEANLRAELEMKGLYHKIDRLKDTGELLEDKYFCIVYGREPKGELLRDDAGHHNEWLSIDAMMKKDAVFQSVPELTDIAKAPHFGFMQQTYEYERQEY